MRAIIAGLLALTGTSLVLVGIETWSRPVATIILGIICVHAARVLAGGSADAA